MILSSHSAAQRGRKAYPRPIFCPRRLHRIVIIFLKFIPTSDCSVPTGASNEVVVSLKCPVPEWTLGANQNNPCLQRQLSSSNSCQLNLRSDEYPRLQFPCLLLADASFQMSYTPETPADQSHEKSSWAGTEGKLKEKAISGRRNLYRPTGNSIQRKQSPSQVIK